jgi:hypothetical protein
MGESRGDKVRIWTDVPLQVGDLSDHPSLICCAVDIVHWDQIGQGACRDTVQLCPLNVDKATCYSAVHKGLSTSLDCCVHHFNLNVDAERH